MKINRKYLYYSLYLLSSIVLFTGCEDEEYKVPTAKTELQNDCLKRSLGPNVVGNRIEFAYAMAVGPNTDVFSSAQVVASIAGAAGTMLEHRAYYTSNGGTELSRTIGAPSSTEATTTQVIFSKDTFAVTLRYFYVIPEEARGQMVTFTFSATTKSGKTVSYPMGPYEISNMDMMLDKVVQNTGNSYISIADMAVYNTADAAANADRIDLVYLYRTVTKSVNGANTNVFAHALVSPAAESQYLPGVTLPAGVNKSTSVSEALNVRDFHLSRTVASSVYVSDLDLQNKDFSTAPNFSINLKADAGLWVETADGTYRAYIYVNSVNNTAQTMTISMKRLKMK